MPYKYLPSYTKLRANKVSKLRISRLSTPSDIQILWLNSFSSQDKSALVSTKTHLHTFFEAHFIIKGQNLYSTEDKNSILLNEKSGIIFAPGEKHRVNGYNDSLVKFSLTFLPDIGSSIYKALCKKTAMVFELPDGLLASLDKILSEVQNKSYLSEVIIRNNISDIICYTAKALDADIHNTESIHNDESEEMRVIMAKRYISDNTHRLLTCKDVAEQCHFNEKYLSRLFKTHTGQTLLEYIHSEKIKSAEALLLDNSLTLKNVSEKLGFSNEYYFNSFFRRGSGITPGQYRKLMLK